MDSMYPDFDYEYTPPAQAGRLTLTPSTTLYLHRHPRLRTAQACEKCRSRKAKCSGEHPSCSRCLARGLPCEYVQAGRVRGPNKQTKSRAGSSASSSHSSRGQASPASLALPHPLPVNVNANANANAKKRRRNTTLATTGMGLGMGMGTGVKLEPLSSCVPLGLGLPPSTNGSINGNGHNHNGYTSPLNAHLLPTGAAKRFSLPALPPSLSLDTHSSSAAYAYPAHRAAAYTDDYLPSSAYTDTSDSGSRRGSFDPPFPPFSLERGVKRGYEHGYEQHRYGEDEEPAVYGGHPLDHHSDLDHHSHSQRAFPLEAGYAVSSSPSFPFPGSGSGYGSGGTNAHEQAGTRTGRPRAVSDVLALGRRGGGGAWDGFRRPPRAGYLAQHGLESGGECGWGCGHRWGHEEYWGEEYERWEHREYGRE
ncbi:hypothetical protein B0H13DRAFT_2539624 [Mycena leptocephala]|nr:hypothetical protein B0H13DRAFT_2539624 [Mycena leptocephala]